MTRQEHRDLTLFLLGAFWGFILGAILVFIAFALA